MPEKLYSDIVLSGLDSALDRYRMFARAHSDFEPRLECERDHTGRRRWVLSVYRRTDAERWGRDEGGEP